MAKKSPERASAVSATSSVNSLAELAELQRQMGAALFRPLTPSWEMQKTDENGRSISKTAAEFIKPN